MRRKKDSELLKIEEEKISEKNQEIDRGQSVKQSL